MIVFGFLLLGVKIANNAKGGGREWAGYALAGVCGLFCVAVIAAGIYGDIEQAEVEARAEEDGGGADRAVLRITRLVDRGHC